MHQQKQYGYAVSNPFFEIWLLLHHDDALDEDKVFAVTETHAYEKTAHFRERLRKLGVPLKKEKHIQFEHYNANKILSAIERAEKLHINKDDMTPKYFATTVYLLLNKMRKMMSEMGH